MVASRGTIQPFLQSQYQLEINTTTTIITFLLVALLQNVKLEMIRPHSTS